MSNILELTQVMTKGNRVEQISGKRPSKAKITEPTIVSFKHNDILKSIQNYNDVYTELRNAIVSAEVAAAENEARASITEAEKKVQTPVDDARRLSLIKEDEQVAQISSVGVAKKRMAGLFVDARKIDGNFGTLGEHFGVNVKPKYLPKALSVPTLYSKVYCRILNSIDLYKLADKSDVVDQYLAENGLINEQIPAKIPSWRKVFENSGVNTVDDVTVAMNSQPVRESEESETFVAPVEKGVSAADYSHRSLLAQINDELEDLRKLRSSPNGFSSPFDSGLEEREDNLLSMLASISGIDTKLKKKKPTFERKNTEFQDLIEGIVGYTKPLTEEEYEIKAAEMESHYQDPDVVQTMEDLVHKDYLFTMNQQDSYDRIMEAERKDNEKKAQESMALDVIEADNVTLGDDVEDTVISLGALDQAQQIKTQIDENKILARGSLEEAQRLVDEDERNKIIIGSKEQAQMFADQDELNMIKAGSLEQAKMLRTLNDFMKKQAEMQQQNELEKNNVIAGAEEQAQMLVAQDETNRVIAGSVEQAQNIINEEEKVAVVKGSMEQAQMFAAQDETNRVVAGSVEQAKNLIGQQASKTPVQEEVDIIDIASDSNSMEDLVSQMAYHNVQSDDLLTGAKAQAEELVNADERNKIVAGSLEQAQAFVAQDETNRVIAGSVEQAKNLISKSSPQKKVDDNVITGAKEQARQIVNAEETRRVVKGAKDQALRIVGEEEKYRAVRGAVVQAQNLINNYETNRIRRGAKDQALRIVGEEEKRYVVNGSVDQAKQLIDMRKTQSVTNNTIPSLQGLNCTTFDVDDRFCSIYSPSRPLKLRSTQKQNLDIRMARGNGEAKKPSTKEQLTFLLDQLEGSKEFDFLRYSDNAVMGAKKAA